MNDLFTLLWLADIAGTIASPGFSLAGFLTAAAGGCWYGYMASNNGTIANYKEPNEYGYSDWRFAHDHIGKAKYIIAIGLFAWGLSAVAPSKTTVLVGLGVPAALEVAEDTGLNDTLSKAKALLDKELDEALTDDG